MHISSIILILLLAPVAYYDFKNMSIPLFFLLFTVLAAFLRLISINSTEPGLSYAVINLTGCGILVACSFLVVFLMRRKVFNPLDTVMGKGDLVFFPVICCTFSPLNFILFFVLSLAVILLIKPLLSQYKKAFPLAGGISVLLAVTLFVAEISSFDLYNDYTVLTRIFR